MTDPLFGMRAPADPKAWAERDPSAWLVGRLDAASRQVILDEIAAGPESGLVAVVTGEPAHVVAVFGCADHDAVAARDAALAFNTLRELRAARATLDEVVARATAARADLAEIAEILDAAGAPRQIERGGPGPDCAEMVEATVADRVRWLVER